MDDDSECEADTKVGAAISACFIASVEEVYIPQCKEDNMAKPGRKLSGLEKRTASIWRSNRLSSRVFQKRWTSAYH